jgi:cytosine/adenosine deaminase-related metal-dependent hydrolase
VGRHAELVERGGRVALGCDASNAGDMADILRAAALAAGLARDMRTDPERFGADTAFALATIAGAEAVGMADRIGSLEPGRRPTSSCTTARRSRGRRRAIPRSTWCGAPTAGRCAMSWSTVEW